MLYPFSFIARRGEDKKGNNTYHSRNLRNLMSVAELKTELERILKRLKCDPSVRKVLLFGSLARGDARDHSDIDLIVVKDTTMRFLDRLDEFYDDAREAMDILVYTPQEFEEMKERPFIKMALREGKMLYEA
jgi:predicted nucleotidyltransferase